MNGDLVYSKSADLYGAYFVVSAYEGWAAGHFGDSVEYVSESNGTLLTINGASSSWGCSHNTGIAFEAAADGNDTPPFASICVRGPSISKTTNILTSLKGRRSGRYMAQY